MNDYLDWTRKFVFLIIGSVLLGNFVGFAKPLDDGKECTICITDFADFVEPIRKRADNFTRECESSVETCRDGRGPSDAMIYYGQYWATDHDRDWTNPNEKALKRHLYPASDYDICENDEVVRRNFLLVYEAFNGPGTKMHESDTCLVREAVPGGSIDHFIFGLVKVTKSPTNPVLMY